MKYRVHGDATTSCCRAARKEDTPDEALAEAERTDGE
jgi:hypothetical protein